MTVPVVAECPERAAVRLAWARAASGHPGLVLDRASMDAGFRSYWRATNTVGSGDFGTWIVMDSPPDKEDVRPWLRVRELLERGGVRVPHVLAQDIDAGFLMLEDLGINTYLQVIGTDNADQLFDAAIAQLLRLQALPCPADLPAYDESMLARELHLFDQWYLGQHLGIVLDDGELATLEHVYRQLTDAALAQPQVFVHRDFMPRNLMPVPDNDGAQDTGPAVLDFQDAVRGPIAYDVISLFKDAFLSWPEAHVDAWIGRYHARALQAGLPVPALERFRRDADLIGVQRHLKIIGIFARLWHRDGKPKYLADVPRFVSYLEIVLPRYPELAPLAAILQRHVIPALASRPFRVPAG
ncbi:aminoglycoside phosphotransferase family protein [Lysobacter sp. A421]